jgi:hypothetical protein
MRVGLWSLLVALVCGGCGPAGPEGLAPAPAGTGPRIVFDLDARPFPDIPFPNDLATRPDPQSPTGRRLNVSLIGPTRLEQRVRARIDRLDGFSTFAPLTVRFDAPLDVAALLERHGAELDFADDAVYLIDITPASPDFGRPVPLDVGYGAYPLTLERPDRYFPNDPRGDQPNLVFETVDEDTDGDGMLDPGEDTDGDGVLDRPNTLTPGGDPIDDLLTCYEAETDTLILRPLEPLRQRTTYAVVLTDRLVDGSGRPVRSPFAWINHLDQTSALAPLPAILADWREQGLALNLEQVAFAWSFTTQSVSRDLELLRQGLYGRGPLAWLAERFPPEVELETAYDDPAAAGINPCVVPADELAGAMRLMAEALFGQNAISDALVDSYAYVDYLVLGRASVPQLTNGLDDVWAIDAERGEARVYDAPLPFLLTVPRERPELGITAPFPVAIYVHGTGGSRMESLGFAGHLAKFGIATVGFDVFLHGLVLGEEDYELFRLLFAGYGFGAMIDRLLDNRTVDINADGRPDEAGNFWSYDVFRIRDGVRQGALDVIRLVQLLRAFDGERSWCQDVDGDGSCELEGLAGDFDGDGRVDLVGPQGPYYLFGISLGGIVGSVAAPLEPAIEAAAPISPGGGLADVAIRSLQAGVPELVLLPFMGPLLYNTSDAETGQPVLAFYLADGRFEASLPVSSMAPLAPGSRVRVDNLDAGEHDEALVDASGRFRVGLPADAGDRLRLTAFGPDGTEQQVIETVDRDVDWQGLQLAAGDPLLAPAEGHGTARQTPDFRRFLQISQTVLDPGDPVNYARHYLLDPLPGDGRALPTSLALLLTAGDMNVPISTGVSAARAAGLIPFRAGERDPRYGATPQRVLIDHWVVEGVDRLRRFAGPPWNDDRRVLLDPDDLSGGRDGFGAPRLSPPLRLGFDSGGGRGLVRFLYPRPRGAHGIMPSDPSRAYDLNRHAINAIGRFFQTGGAVWSDDPCQADDSCDWIPAPP